MAPLGNASDFEGSTKTSAAPSRSETSSRWPRNDHGALEAARAHQRLELRTARTVADDLELHVGEVGGELRGGGNQRFVALLGPQVRDGDDPPARLAARRASRRSRGIRMRATGKRVRVDAVRDDRNRSRSRGLPAGASSAPPLNWRRPSLRSGRPGAGAGSGRRSCRDSARGGCRSGPARRPAPLRASRRCSRRGRRSGPRRCAAAGTTTRSRAARRNVAGRANPRIGNSAIDAARSATRGSHAPAFSKHAT